MEFNFETDEDTQRLFEIAVYFLQKYFDYEAAQATQMINKYYFEWRSIHDDDYYHHMSSYETAVRVHYFIGLRKHQDDYLKWKLANGLMKAPYEALEYFQTHYFKRADSG